MPYRFSGVRLPVAQSLLRFPKVALHVSKVILYVSEVALYVSEVALYVSKVALYVSKVALCTSKVALYISQSDTHIPEIALMLSRSRRAASVLCFFRRIFQLKQHHIFHMMRMREHIHRLDGLHPVFGIEQL